MADARTLLVVVAGRPGTGKSTLATGLARELKGAYPRLDAIVDPLLTAGLTEDESRAAETGYQIAREVARENLGAGVPVVVDGLHATHERRHQWSAVAAATEARLEILETHLDDVREDRRRIEERTTSGAAEYPGPSWEKVQAMAYEPWDEERSGERLVVEMSDSESALARAIGHLTRR